MDTEKETKDEKGVQLNITAGAFEVGVARAFEYGPGQDDPIGLLYAALKVLEPGTELYTRIGAYLGVF